MVLVEVWKVDVRIVCGALVEADFKAREALALLKAAVVMDAGFLMRRARLEA